MSSASCRHDMPLSWPSSLRAQRGQAVEVVERDPGEQVGRQGPAIAQRGPRPVEHALIEQRADLGGAARDHPRQHAGALRTPITNRPRCRGQARPLRPRSALATPSPPSIRRERCQRRPSPACPGAARTLKPPESDPDHVAYSPCSCSSAWSGCSQGSRTLRPESRYAGRPLGRRRSGEARRSSRSDAASILTPTSASEFTRAGVAGFAR